MFMKKKSVYLYTKRDISILNHRFIPNTAIIKGFQYLIFTNKMTCGITLNKYTLEFKNKNLRKWT